MGGTEVDKTQLKNKMRGLVDRQEAFTRPAIFHALVQRLEGWHMQQIIAERSVVLKKNKLSLTVIN